MQYAGFVIEYTVDGHIMFCGPFCEEEDARHIMSIAPSYWENKRICRLVTYL